jgi:hypothetical protein
MVSMGLPQRPFLPRPSSFSLPLVSCPFSLLFLLSFLSTVPTVGSSVLPSETPVAEDPALSPKRFFLEGSQVDLPRGLDLHVAPLLQSPVSFEGSQTRLRVSGPILMQTCAAYQETRFRLRGL